MVAAPDYFTFAEVRALPDMNATAYTDDRIAAAAAFFVARVEEELQTSFVKRPRTEVLSGRNLPSLLLGSGYVQLLSVTVAGTPVDLGSLTAVSGVLQYVGRTKVWPVGTGNVVVTYLDGRYATPPADIKDACLWATRDRLLAQGDRSGVDVRKTSVSTDFGTTSYILPGENRPTGYPDLDAVIATRLRTSTSLGFA